MHGVQKRFSNFALQMVKDLVHIRDQFPILKTNVGKYPLVYFDNGATTEKPQIVIDSIQDYYEKVNANIHRGVHYLSQLATERYEAARKQVQSFINAEHHHEVIFTYGTTDSINMVAGSFGKTLSKGDEVIVTEMEHHSNIVPWHMLQDEKGIIVKYIPIQEDGTLALNQLEKLVTDRTKLLAITHVSNSLGTINPIKEIIQKMHGAGVKVLVDAAQSIPHLPVDVRDLDCDFLAFSGHKVFGPTGIGVLYGKAEILDEIPPYRGGGGMIKNVSMNGTTYIGAPEKFEAGTPNIAGAIGLGVALDWMNALDVEAIENYELDLLSYGTAKLKEAVEGVKIYGNAPEKSAILSFLVEGTHPYDIGTLLNQQGIAVRTGHHCTQPIMDFYKIPGTIRASFSFYNTKEEIDRFIEALTKSVNMLR